MRGVRIFCAAARHESFRAAADELFVTASAVSHQVRKLEAELRVELFERSGRSIRLTAAGQQFFEKAERAVQLVDAAVTEVRNDYRRVSLRVSVQPFFASEFFVPRLSEFTAAHPGIDIQIDTSDETSERHPATADVSIRLFREPPDGLAADVLFPLKLVPACSAAFREQLNVVGWHVAKALPMIIHSSRPNSWRRWSERSGIRVPQTTNYIRLDTMSAVAQAAEQGMGVALVPVPLANHRLQTGRLVKLFDYELVTRESYYLVCDTRATERPEIEALRHWVLQAFASD